MEGRKVIISTSFREFNGNSNDYIQRTFLRSLKAQTYQNYVLAATTFNEKNVEKALIEEGIPHVVKQGFVEEGFRFSVTEVIKNAMILIDKKESYILIWTCCDDLYAPDFLEKLVQKLTPMSSATSLPHIVYKTVEDYKKGNIGGYTYGGVDFVCFDADIFLLPEVQKVVRDYPNKGWGMTEYFLSGIGRVFCKNMYNLWPTKVGRIDNDRVVSKEGRDYFDLSISHNRRTYGEFVKKYGIKGDEYSHIFLYKTSWKYLNVKLNFIFRISRYRLEAVSTEWMKKYLPQGIKNRIKRVLNP
jgi:hypothetical protein